MKLNIIDSIILYVNKLNIIKYLKTHKFLSN